MTEVGSNLAYDMKVDLPTSLSPSNSIVTAGMKVLMLHHDRAFLIVVTILLRSSSYS